MDTRGAIRRCPGDDLVDAGQALTDQLETLQAPVLLVGVLATLALASPVLRRGGRPAGRA